jgi:hypothetical protein
LVVEEMKIFVDVFAVLTGSTSILGRTLFSRAGRNLREESAGQLKRIAPAALDESTTILAALSSVKLSP